jgi:hypothetical protein
MAITVVQTAVGSRFTSPATMTVTLASPITAGNTIIVAGIGTAGTFTTPTDNHSNTFHAADSRSVNSFCEIFYAYNINSGASDVISSTLSNGVCCCVPVTEHALLLAMEVSGLITTDPLDVHTTGAAGSGASTASAGPTSTTTVAAELVAMAAASAGSLTYTVGSGYSNLIQQGSGSPSGAMQSKVVAATGTQSGSMAMSATSDYTAVIATFKGPAATTVNAGLATVSDVGYVATPQISAQAGVATTTDTAYVPTVKVAPTVQVATVTATAYAPTVSISLHPGVPNVTATGLAPIPQVTAFPQAAAVTDVAYNAMDTSVGVKGYRELAGVLNQLAGTKGLGTAGAANVYAGTTNLEVVGALNARAGNSLAHYRDFDGVCNQLASTSGWSGVGALNHLAGNTL